MDEERVVKLLEEIRDAQAEHLALYRTGLENQQASVQSQQEAIAYQRRAMKRIGLVIAPILALVIGLALWVFLQF